VARIVLTLPEPRASAWATALRALGHEALVLSFVALRPASSEPSAAALLARAEGFDRVVLVSPTAVEVFADSLPDGWPAGLAPAVVGPGSLAALAARGLDRHPGLLVPPGPEFDADALLALPELAAPLDAAILVVRAQAGNPRLERELAARGARIEVLEAYRRERLEAAPDALARLAGWLAEPAAAWPRLLVTTTDAAERLAELADGSARLAGLRALDALAIHPRIAAKLRETGWRSVATIGPGFDACRAAIESADGATESPAARAQRSGTERD